MTITREQFRELAQFQDGNSCAVSFYFQPSTPRNKAHREDTILIKDLVREAARILENKSLARADLDRIQALKASKKDLFDRLVGGLGGDFDLSQHFSSMKSLVQLTAVTEQEVPERVAEPSVPAAPEISVITAESVLLPPQETQ